MKKCCRKKKLKSGFSRRQFLSMMGTAGAAYSLNNPLKIFFDGLADGLIASVQAQGILQPRNFICILFPGAPTRWVWDNYLQPNGSADGFIRNASVNNWITEDSYSADNTKVTYKSDRIDLPDGRVIHLPTLWTQDIPVVGGGRVKMTELLNNAMLMRGINMQVDIGHKFGPTRVPRPISSGPSISGNVADRARTPIQAVGTSVYNQNFGDPSIGAYKSNAGTGITLVRGINDPLGQIMSAFTNTDSQVIAKMPKYDSISPLVKSALDDLAIYAKSSKPGADALFKSRSNAEDMFKKSYGNLTDAFNQLYTKYRDLERRSGQMAMPNILPTVGTGTYSISSTNTFTGLASQFAVAEFLLKNGLSSTITMGGESPRVAGLSNNNDEHDQSDRQRSLICHSFQFRALASMIYELKRSLGPTLWEQTVVEVSAEFERSPTNDQSGSDHEPEANAVTVFSGAIQKPIFIGNIRVQGRGGVYTGTYGLAAPVKTDFASALVVTNEHAASTVSTIIGVESPVRSPSLVRETSSGFVSLAEDPKNVG